MPKQNSIHLSFDCVACCRHCCCRCYSCCSLVLYVFIHLFSNRNFGDTYRMCLCVFVCVWCASIIIFCVWPGDRLINTDTQCFLSCFMYSFCLARSLVRSLAFHVLFICHVLVFRCIWIAHAHDTSANITYTMWYNVMHIPIIYTLHSTRTLIHFYDVHNCQFCCFQSTRFRWTMETACVYTQLKNTQK